MRFEYKNGYYSARIRYTRKLYGITKEINAIFDTGCSTTSMSLYSLAFLLNESYEKLISDLNNPVYDSNYLLSADNEVNRATRVALPDIYLIPSRKEQGDFLRFEKFFCSVSTDIDLAKNDGIINTVINGEVVNYQSSPYVLLGYDIINSFDYFNGDKNRIYTGKFDKQKYYKNQKEMNPHPLLLFKNKELNT